MEIRSGSGADAPDDLPAAFSQTTWRRLAADFRKSWASLCQSSGDAGRPCESHQPANWGSTSRDFSTEDAQLLRNVGGFGVRSQLELDLLMVNEGARKRKRGSQSTESCENGHNPDVDAMPNARLWG